MQLFGNSYKINVRIWNVVATLWQRCVIADKGNILHESFNFNFIIINARLNFTVYTAVRWQLQNKR